MREQAERAIGNDINLLTIIDSYHYFDIIYVQDAFSVILRKKVPIFKFGIHVRYLEVDFTHMLNYIRATRNVSYLKAVRYSEGPLWEAPLYINPQNLFCHHYKA